MVHPNPAYTIRTEFNVKGWAVPTEKCNWDDECSEYRGGKPELWFRVASLRPLPLYEPVVAPPPERVARNAC